MLIEILKHKDRPFSIRAVAEHAAFVNYKADQEQSLPLDSLVSYVILLYSKDSILNKKPMLPLAQRRKAACLEVDLDPNDENVKSLVFDLQSEKVRDMILEYLFSLNEYLWAERNILEIQIQENHKLRMKPIKNKTAQAPKKKKKPVEEEFDLDDDDEREDDDKYLLEASDKKSKLTDHFEKYYALLKKYDAEIFGDHDNVKEAFKKTRKTLEDMAK